MKNKKKVDNEEINKEKENKWSDFFYASIANFIYTIIWGLFGSSILFYIIIKLLKEKNSSRNLLEYYFPTETQYYGCSTIDNDNKIHDCRNNYSSDKKHINNLYNSYLPLYNNNTTIDGKEYYDNDKKFYLGDIYNILSVYIFGVNKYPIYKQTGGNGDNTSYEYEDCDYDLMNINIESMDDNDIYKYNIIQRWAIYCKNTILKTTAKSLKFERENIIHTLFEIFCKNIDKSVKAPDINNTDNELFNNTFKNIIFILSPLLILLLITVTITSNVFTSIYYGFKYIVSNSITFTIFLGYLFPFITGGLTGLYTFFEMLMMFSVFPLYKNYPKNNKLLQKIFFNNKNTLIFIFSILSIMSSFNYLKLEISISMIVFTALYFIKTIYF